MNNKNNEQKEYLENINPIIIQEKIIDELLKNKEKLKQMISYTEKLKKEKSLNWIIPILSWNVTYSIAISIIVSIIIALDMIPSIVILPILGKIPTILAALIGINLLATIGMIENIGFNYRCFYQEIEEQEINKNKLQLIENKIKSEQKYLEELKKQNLTSEFKTSSFNELARLKLLKNYLLRYVSYQYVPKELYHETDIYKCNCEMEQNYPDNDLVKRENEIEEVKVLLKK